MTQGDHPSAETHGLRTSFHEGAIILPSTKGPARNNYAVLDNGGAILPAADTWRTTPVNASAGRTAPNEVAALAGTHMFGGMIFHHFGHAFVEATARLHAYPELRNKIDSILFVAYRKSQTTMGRHEGVFETLGIDTKLQVIDQPTRVERLYIPSQLGGLGRHAAGAPPLHDFFAQAAARIEPEGPEKLFISRARYRMKRGGALCEDLLEANMAAQGYTLYSPEKDSLAGQMAKYRAAKVIAGLDSTAFHVIAASGNPALKSAIILRRRSGADDIGPQIEGFSGQKPLVINAIRRMWHAETGRQRPWDHFAEVDFADVARQLDCGGFLTDPSAWQDATPECHDAYRERYEKDRGRRLGTTERAV